MACGTRYKYFLIALDKAFSKLKDKCNVSLINSIQISAQQHGHVYLSKKYEEYQKNMIEKFEELTKD